MAGLRGAEACQGGWVDEWRGVARGAGWRGEGAAGVEALERRGGWVFLSLIRCG